MASQLLIIVGEPWHEHQSGEVLVGQVVEGLKNWDNPDANLHNLVMNFINADVPLDNVQASSGPSRLLTTPDVTVLLEPRRETVQAQLLRMNGTNAMYNHVLFAGCQMRGSGAWLLDDSVLSCGQLVKWLTAKQQSPSNRYVVSCVEEGQFVKGSPKHHPNVVINPTPSAPLDVTSFGAELASHLLSKGAGLFTPLPERLTHTGTVGNLGLIGPTFYSFPAGGGSGCLFGVPGFTLLIDGGYERAPLAWNFLRHVDRLDAALVTQPVLPESGRSIGSMVERLAVQGQSAGSGRGPKLGYIFMNTPPKRTEPKASPHPLLVNAYEEANRLADACKSLSLQPHPLLVPLSSKPEPIVLYSKMGCGHLDMYVLSPAKDSKELKELFDHWSSHKFSPVAETASSAAVLVVWHPANPSERVVRILYTGALPQGALFKALDRLKSLEFLKHYEYVPSKVVSPGSKVQSRAAGGSSSATRQSASGTSRVPPTAAAAKPAAARPTRQSAAASASATRPTAERTKPARPSAPAAPKLKATPPAAAAPGGKKPSEPRKKPEPAATSKKADAAAKKQPEPKKEKSPGKEKSKATGIEKGKKKAPKAEKVENGQNNNTLASGDLLGAPLLTVEPATPRANSMNEIEPAPVHVEEAQAIPAEAEAPAEPKKEERGLFSGISSAFTAVKEKVHDIMEPHGSEEVKDLEEPVSTPNDRESPPPPFGGTKHESSPPQSPEATEPEAQAEVTSPLSPDAPEFVPKGFQEPGSILSPDAPEFVPKGGAVIPPSFDDLADHPPASGHPFTVPHSLPEAEQQLADLGHGAKEKLDEVLHSPTVKEFGEKAHKTYDGLHDTAQESYDEFLASEAGQKATHAAEVAKEKYDAMSSSMHESFDDFMKSPTGEKVHHAYDAGSEKLHDLADAATHKGQELMDTPTGQKVVGAAHDAYDKGAEMWEHGKEYVEGIVHPHEAEHADLAADHGKGEPQDLIDVEPAQTGVENAKEQAEHAFDVGAELVQEEKHEFQDFAEKQRDDLGDFGQKQEGNVDFATEGAFDAYNRQVDMFGQGKDFVPEVAVAPKSEAGFDEFSLGLKESAEDVYDKGADMLQHGKEGAEDLAHKGHEALTQGLHSAYDKGAELHDQGKHFASDHFGHPGHGDAAGFGSPDGAQEQRDFMGTFQDGFETAKDATAGKLRDFQDYMSGGHNGATATEINGNGFASPTDPHQQGGAGSLKNQWGGQEPQGLPVAPPRPTAGPAKPSRLSAGRAGPPPAASSGAARLAAARPGSAGSSASARRSAPAAGAAKRGGTSQPFYFDLAYIPSGQVTEDFFASCRARYYVLSGLEHETGTMDAFLDGKRAWANPGQPANLIPMYDSDTLALWLGLHEGDLDRENVDVLPSAIRCTMNLQEDSDAEPCRAHRLEL